VTLILVACLGRNYCWPVKMHVLCRGLAVCLLCCNWWWAMCLRLRRRV